MDTITVKTQAEWDSLPAAFEKLTVVEIRSTEIVTVLKIPTHSRVSARDSSRVVARESSRVVAWDCSIVEDYKSQEKNKHESKKLHERDWAIRNIVEGKESDRIIECKTEVEARDWVERFPQSYQLLSRQSAGGWSKVS